MSALLVRVSFVVMEHDDQKAIWGRKGLLGLYFHTSVHHRRKSGQKLKQSWNLEQELMQKPWRSDAYWIALHGLLSLLSYRTQNQKPIGSTTHHRLGYLPLINN